MCNLTDTILIESTRIKLFSFYRKKLIAIRLFLMVNVTSIGMLTAQQAIGFKHFERTFRQDSQVVFDSLGYAWISGNEGLYKYDGYDYFLTPYSEIMNKESVNTRNLIFKKDNEQGFWLATIDGDLIRMRGIGNYTSFKIDRKIHQRISTIQPEENFVWFGTSNGSIYRYDYSTSKIDSIATIPYNDGKPQDIRTIAFTDPRTLWASTFSGMVFQYQQTGSGASWKKLEGPYYTPMGGLTKLVADNNGRLWIISENTGLYVYNVNDSKFFDYAATLSKENRTKPLFISIYFDGTSKIWAGTDGDGLYRIDITNNKIDHFTYKSSNRFSLSNNTVLKINEDPNGNIWLLTKDGFIDVLPKVDQGVDYYSGSENGAPKPILSIFRTTYGELWLGTDGFGLSRILTDGQILQYSMEKEGNEYFQGKFIQSIEEDNKGNIWMGTYQNGLYLYDRANNEFKRIPIRDQNGRAVSDIRCVYKDSKGRIWATTSLGLYVFSDKQKAITSFAIDGKGLKGTISESILESKDGTLWIGVINGGLFRFKEDSVSFSESTFEHVPISKDGPEQNDGVTVSNLNLDSQENLWFTSRSGALIQLNTRDLSCMDHGKLEILNDINMLSLLLDAEDKVWIGSTSGLHKFDSEKGVLRSYYATNGFQGDIYKRGSSFKSDENKLFFGGNNGANAFYPTNLIDKVHDANLYINGIDILHKPAEELIPEQIDGSYESITSLKLKSNQSSFSFRFSAIDNLLSTNYNYTYKLEGFDEEWIVPKSDLRATYTNVPPGDYVFRVKAGTEINNWDIGPKQLAISISPPWWSTIWAYLIYALVATLLFFGAYRWLQLRNKLHQEELLYNNEKELYALKMNFFAKMSHEIQTPLALILGPIDDMFHNATVNKNRLLMQRLTLIKKNAERLSRISKDLTTVRNKELNQLKLKALKNDIVKDIKNIAMSFDEQARFKKIDFIQELPKHGILMWYDRDKIEHVMYNLLSNAFKFTPSEGTITLKISENAEKEQIKISVIDTGSGIPKKELKDIFTLFYRSDSDKNLSGSGIGLALTKELVSIHHGKIKVNSSKGKGSSFHIYLPTSEDVFSNEEKINDNHSGVLQDHQEDEFNAPESEPSKNKISKENRNHRVLIVEDNVEMQIFLKDLLIKDYEITIAENGKEGFEFSKEQVPDLIISDIMMPVMDGIEMSQLLKRNKKTSHIPLILLTAKNTTKSKLLGLQSGAVAYINKPFNPQELVLKIQNLLKSKEQIISKVKTDFISSGASELPESKDHTFLKDLVKNLNYNIDDSDFKLEQLSDLMNMSYSVIYRKCQEITGKTLVEYYRSLKMKRAALLIVENGYNISEAAFMVGYKDSKYFSKCFRGEFGTAPQSMKNEGQKMGLNALFKKYGLKSI